MIRVRGTGRSQDNWQECREFPEDGMRRSPDSEAPDFRFRADLSKRIYAKARVQNSVLLQKHRTTPADSRAAGRHRGCGTALDRTGTGALFLWPKPTLPRLRIDRSGAHRRFAGAPRHVFQQVSLQSLRRCSAVRLMAIPDSEVDHGRENHPTSVGLRLPNAESHWVGGRNAGEGSNS
jgi:hypothetical protein